MFDSLNDQIKHDDAVETSRKERVVKGLVAILSILLFGGLYLRFG